MNNALLAHPLVTCTPGLDGAYQQHNTYAGGEGVVCGSANTYAAGEGVGQAGRYSHLSSSPRGVVVTAHGFHPYAVYDSTHVPSSKPTNSNSHQRAPTVVSLLPLSLERMRDDKPIVDLASTQQRHTHSHPLTLGDEGNDLSTGSQHQLDTVSTRGVQDLCTISLHLEE